MKPSKLVLAMLVLLILVGCAPKQMYSSEGSPPIRKKAAKAKKFVDAAPPEVKLIPTQQLLDKGNEAAQSGDWRQAIHFYSLTQKRRYLSPQLMYNLAVAHSKADNELLADIWFRAYLCAVPEAANAEQVKAEIARLEEAAQAKANRLFDQAKQLAELLPVQGDGSGYGEGRRAEALQQIRREREGVGDLKGATAAEEYAQKVNDAAEKMFRGKDLDGEIDTFRFEQEIRSKGCDGILNEIIAGKHTYIFAPVQTFYELNYMIKYSIRHDDIQSARRVVRAIDDFIRNGMPQLGLDNRLTREKSDDNRRWVRGWTSWGKAYLDVENGKARDAIKRIDQGAHDVNDTVVGGILIAGQPEGHYEALRREWLSNICGFAISRKKLDVAEQLADAFLESRNQIEFVKQITSAYQAQGDATNSERLKQKVATLTAEASRGWDEPGTGREASVVAWEEAAYDFNQKWVISDLEVFLSKQKDSPTETPSYMAYGARDLASGLLKIRALGKRWR